jgi:hypothetical protein
LEVKSVLSQERPTAAFILSLLGGIFILLGGGMWGIIGSFMGSYGFSGMMGFYGRRRGMMGSAFGMMGLAFGLVGLVFGAIVIISAVMLNKKPEEHNTWGTLIIVFSVLSIFGGMSGFGAGLILGLVGGILAITWRPPVKPTE